MRKAYFSPVIIYSTLIFFLAGCTTAAPTGDLLPVTGASSPHVNEFTLVEQSVDNPDHIQFAERAMAAVESNGIGEAGLISEGAVEAANRDLAQFGCRLENSAVPPYSGYALYSGDTLVHDNIAWFWQVAYPTDDGGADDFLFRFLTFSGEEMIASRTGLQVLSNRPSGGQGTAVKTGPSLAFAGSGEMALFNAGMLQPSSAPRNHQFSEQGLEQGVIFSREVGEKVFLLTTEQGLIHLKFDNKDLPYIYDAVIFGQTGPLAIFNPGANGNTAWFYALRDGLWYYIEVRLPE